jgi:hypothetical protein
MGITAGTLILLIIITGTCNVWESGGIGPPFLTSAIEGDVSGQLHAPTVLLPGKEPTVATE